MKTEEALLLVGHGSSRHRQAGRILRNHAAWLGHALWPRPVRIAFLAGEPRPDQVLVSLRSRVVHVVPFFMEAGHFSTVALPRALSPDTGPAPWPGQEIRLHKAVGTHAMLAGAIVRRLRAACVGADIDAADAVAVLVGHGSARAPGRHLSLHDHAAHCRDVGAFHAVRVACLEEPPSVQDVLQCLPDRPVVILGLFADEGGHVRDDLPAAMAAARGSRAAPVVDGGIIGDDPILRDIVIATISA